MGKALHAELQKARRRHDLLICLAVPVDVYKRQPASWWAICRLISERWPPGLRASVFR